MRLLGLGKDFWGLGKAAEAADKAIPVTVRIYKVSKFVGIKRLKSVDKNHIVCPPTVE